MAHFEEKIKQRSGITLGGIGTGSVELFPDGELHQWQIYNTHRWARRSFENKVDDGEAYTGALSFFLRCEDKKGGRVLRRLGFHTESEEFTWRMFTEVRPVEKITFDGEFPTARLGYEDPALACRVSSLFTAPFLPHDEKASGMPAFAVEFHLENPTDHSLKVSLAAKLKTDFCNKNGEVHTLLRQGSKTYLTVTPKEKAAASDGSLTLSAWGGKVSALTGDYTAYLDEYVSHSPYGIAQESFLFPFLERGVLPNSTAGEALAEDFFEENGMTAEEKVTVLLAYPFAQSLLERIQRVYPDYLEKPSEKEEFISVCARQVRDISRNKEKPFGGSALAQSVTLKPHGRAVFYFVFSWHFPNHLGEDGKLLGHEYENRFANALAVNRNLTKDYARIIGGAQKFAALLYDTTLPTCYSDAWSSHLSTLVKDSWWLKDGLFGLWEGLGYCGFATTDITYHASHSLAALFPALQKRQMRMTAAHQREDGRMPHFFTPDLYRVDDGFHRVDMNPQFVLLVARDYLTFGDKTHLADLWQPVVSAIASTLALDENGDGLPDTHTGYNTYDAWRFKGTPSYIAFLWLSSLKAACFLADELGDTAHQKEWSAILEKGKKAAEGLLFNGKYYDLWTTSTLDDPTGERDGCLMSNQLDGELFLRLIGLEGNLSDRRVASVLRYIYRHNFKKNAGLVNATCPDGTEPTVFTYKNCQAEARWTGIAYLFAAALSGIGEEEKAKEVIETVHDCQSRLGYFFNHWECGFRYTRPLSSWATLSAASGITYHMPTGSLAVTKKGRYPLVTGGALATVDYTEDRLTLTVTEGSLTVNTLTLAGKPYPLSAPLTLTEDAPLILT